MSLISRLGVVLGLDAGEFNKNLGIAQERLQGFNQSIIGSRLGVAAIGTAFATAAVSAVRFADSINDISQASELSVKTVLRLNEALIVNGGNADTAGQIINKFARSVYEANHQNKEMQDSFKALGISMEDLRTKSMEQLIFKSIDGFKKLGDVADRTGVAFGIVGRNAKNIDWQGVADALEKNRKSYDDAQIAFQQIGNAIDNLNKISFAMKTDFATNIGGAFEYITDKAIAYYNAMASINEFLEQKMGKWKYLVPGAAYLPEHKIATRDETGKSFNFADQINREQQQNKDVLALIKKQEEFYKKELMITEAKRQRNQKEVEYAFLMENEKKLQLEIFDIEQKQKLLIEEKKMNKAQAAEWAALEKKRAEEEYKIAQSQRNFEYGWKKASVSYVENMTNAAKMGEQAFVSITQNMESALDRFVETGKLSFKDLARSIIQDLIKIQMRAQLAGVFGKISGIFSGGYSPGYSDFANAPYPKYADGGTINGPAIVGERGPELFIPSGSGTIIPNNQLSSAMGNQPQVVYNGPYIQNMSAIDTQSAVSFLAQNKQAVWAANQSAQRSLPQSR